MPHMAAGVLVAGAAVSLVWAAVRHTGVETTPDPPRPASTAFLGFAPPAAGTYQLERILQAPDGAVLDSDGSTHRLHEFTRGKITLFSFIYTHCTDVQGCPLAYATLHALQDMIAVDSRLRGQVRFVSMSFDPEFDTPAMMRSYGGADARAGAPVPWHFLTTSSPAQLAPMLAGFGQDVSATGAHLSGTRVPILSHLLKVYLIDSAGSVREIYSPAYLHPAVLFNDVLTVRDSAPGSRPAF
jgi:cytochrome oxidase Cu insertion factor (SCO1/SenC/PrrC family)